MQTEFVAARERFRYATPDDLPAIVGMLQEEAVGRWLFFLPAPVAALEAYLGPLIEAQGRELGEGSLPAGATFVVEDLEGGFLGMAAALGVDGSPGGFEIGYQLAEASWGRGVGTRSARFVAAWAVYLQQAYRLEASLLAGNEASRKILSGVGLVEEGRRPGYRLKDGVRHTQLLYGAVIDEALRARLAPDARQAGLLT